MKLVAVSVVVALLVSWLGLVLGACDICQSRECIKEKVAEYNTAVPDSSTEVFLCVQHQMLNSGRTCKACEDMAKDSACLGLNMASWCVDPDCFKIAVPDNYRSDFCNGPFVSGECSPCKDYKDKGENDINTP